MRLLALLALAGLAASAVLAPRHYAARPGDLPPERFVDPPARRVEEGERTQRLGVVLSGYEDLVREDPDDLDALRGRIRTGLLIGAVSLSQPGVHELIALQVDSYLERREELDPDGSFIRGVCARWIDERLRFDWSFLRGFHARTAASLYSAALGDPRGVERLRELAAQGQFFAEVFPYIRRMHPAWRGVEPLVRHYLEQGDLVGRLEAGATLLEYQAVFGEGEELVRRFLPDIRSAIKEIRGRLRRLAVDETTATGGRAAVLCMGLLGALGEPEELLLVRRARDEAELRLYTPFADTMRMAQLMCGLGSFERYNPSGPHYDLMGPPDQELYFTAAAVRAARLRAEGQTGGPEFGGCVRVLEEAFEAGSGPQRLFAMQALLRLAPQAGEELRRRALQERSMVSFWALVLDEEQRSRRLDLVLPVLQTPEIGAATVAALTVANGGTTAVLQQ